VLVNFTRLIGMPYLMHVHDADYGADFTGRGPIMRRLVTGIFRGARTTIVLGHHDQSRLSDLFDLKGGEIIVLHNAVPDPRPRPRIQRSPDSDFHILFLGHLSERKGVPELLRALATSQLVDQRWRATLAGGGDLDMYRGMAAELGITDRVTFPGWVDQPTVRGLLESADVLVLPSHGEGMAMSVLEGLSHGLPVITTPVGAHTEVIENGRSGILVPPGDEEALASAITVLIKDDELLGMLGANARAHFLEHFEMRGYARRLSALHSALLTAR
jgi:glycosyltransferase involved in cell wall biosynthesis